MKYLSYLFNQTARNIQQTFSAQLMTLLAVSLSVLLFSFFYLIYTNTLEAETKLTNELRLILYLDNELSPEAQNALEKKIREFNTVQKIFFVSRQEAFKRLEKQLGSDKDVLQDLDASFLPPSVEVYPSRDFKTLANIKKFSDYLATLPGAEKVQYGHDWLERFGNFADLLRIIVLLSSGMLILTTLFMVSYTIRITVTARQAELEILRFMGATSSYVRGPLLVEGFLQGLLGSTIGLAALYALFIWVQARFSGPGLLNLLDITFFTPMTTAGILLAGATLCTCGSSVTMRKFLRI
jgi:cell division transport system permease protein